MGPVGRELLEVEWDGTPLGPPAHWPQSLRTIATMLLSSRFSMWMAWGPELTFLCNDAYRRDTLGKKYPWALGRPAREVWAEIWPDIGPRIEHVMRTGQATWDEALLLFLERNGYAEETYHTFSYSPLTDDGGRIAGMLCVVTEDTERVIANSRIATLRDLGSDLTSLHSEAEILETASRHLAANPKSIPFCLLYLFEDQSDTAHLTTSVGFRPGHPAAPPIIVPGDDGIWPASKLAAGTPVLMEIGGHRYRDLPTGVWNEPPEYAYLVPLGQQGEARPWGFLVVGLNRHRPFDGDYRSFLDLVGGQISAGLASGRAYETERRRAEQLAELDRAKTQFFTNISHELRTPLTLLLGPAEDALGDEDDPLAEKQHERLELIQRNAWRLLHLVNNLLDFSRIEAGRLPARFEEVDLTRDTAEVASMFRAAVERAGLTLELDLEPVGARVYVDRDMWAKIVLNLLSNAVKHTFEGGIEVRLRRLDGVVELSVRDTGIGIAKADQPLLFERFRRVEDARARSYEGSGIGLALVAELAALHGGEVGLDSTPGEGSTFTVRLPLGNEHLPVDQVTTSPAATNAPLSGGVEGFIAEVMRWLETSAFPSGATHGTADLQRDVQQTPRSRRSGRPRVLVADDNADMRAYISRLLEQEYEVLPAADGQEALELALSNPPDLVLSDVMMPRLDGFGLVRELRRHPATVGVPVVMVSARAGDEGVVEGLEAGADNYLVKPFSARELVARVRSSIELDRVRRTRDELERHRSLLDQAQRLAHIGSWEIDVESGAVTASDELLRILGISRAELEQLGWEGALRQISQAPWSDAVAELKEAVARGEGRVDHQIFLGTVVGHDEEGRWVHMLGEVVTDEEGRVRKLRGSIQDVTDQHEAERTTAAAAAEREATAREHRIADELQRSLLPPRTFDPEHLGVATYYRAGVEGTQVGGDWYDVIELGAGRTALVIGDVMGRGVRAAAVMGQLRSAIRAYARLDLAPADVLELCDVLVRDLGGNQIVTCIYACYDPTDRSVTYARAGHLPPVLAVPGEPARALVAPGGPPLGAGPISLVNQRIELAPGAAIALYTDGLIERRNRDLGEGMAALAAELTDAIRQPIDELPERMVRTMLDGEPDDDIAVLVARVPADKPAPESLAVEVPSDPGAVRYARSKVMALLQRWGIPQDLADDVVLVVSELVTNALVHGAPPVRLNVSRTSGQLILGVSDAGTLMPRRQRMGLDDEHGRGLHVVTVLADHWGARPVADGKCVWCAFDLDPSATRQPVLNPKGGASRELVG